MISHISNDPHPFDSGIFDERKLRCLYDMENQTYKMYMSIVHIDVKHTHMAWKIVAIAKQLAQYLPKRTDDSNGEGKGGRGRNRAIAAQQRQLDTPNRPSSWAHEWNNKCGKKDNNNHIRASCALQLQSKMSPIIPKSIALLSST